MMIIDENVAFWDTFWSLIGHPFDALFAEIGHKPVPLFHRNVGKCMRNMSENGDLRKGSITGALLGGYDDLGP